MIEKNDENIPHTEGGKLPETRKIREFARRFKADASVFRGYRVLLAPIGLISMVLGSIFYLRRSGRLEKLRSKLESKEAA